MLPNLFRGASRSFATSAAAATEARAYPFSKTVIIHPEPSKKQAPRSIREGRGVMPFLAKSLPTPEKRAMLDTLFSRKSPKQLRPGSILTINMEHAPTVFTGVLISIRRKGMDTSIVVRNVIQRTGVDMQLYVNSPHLKEIKVLRTPPNGRMKRAKLYFLRDDPDKMNQIAGSARKL